MRAASWPSGSGTHTHTHALRGTRTAHHLIRTIISICRSRKATSRNSNTYKWNCDRFYLEFIGQSTSRTTNDADVSIGVNHHQWILIESKNGEAESSPRVHFVCMCVCVIVCTQHPYKIR